MKPLISSERGPSLTLRHIDQPVEDKLREGDDNGAAGEPYESGVDEAMSTHQVSPSASGCRMTFSEEDRCTVPILSSREKIALEREIGEGVADHECEQKC